METVALLEKSRWWELQADVLSDYVGLMDKPKEFCSAIRKLHEKESFIGE